MDTIDETELESIALLSRRFAPTRCAPIKENKNSSTNVMKELHMSYDEVKIAKFSKIIINKYNGVACPAEHEPVFKELKGSFDSGADSSYIFHMIPTTLNNPMASCAIMNHIMMCTDPKCSNEMCYYVKNLMKYNIIKTSMNRNDAEKTSINF